MTARDNWETPPDWQSECGRVSLWRGDCLDVLKGLPDCSVDACVTDPPYGLRFMGKAWDYDVPTVAVWEEVLRVLKPGGHLLSFAGTRTQHRMAVNIEDAGFEIRDMIAWIYGSGFPKSLDVSKAIDSAAGAEREVVSKCFNGVGNTSDSIHKIDGFASHRRQVFDVTAPATSAAKQWEGWGTAIKPALEPLTLARKPLCSTVAANVLKHGTGAINVDGCRVETEEVTGWGCVGSCGFSGGLNNNEAARPANGRFPANLIHDGSAEVVALFPEGEPAKAGNRGLQHSGRHGGLSDFGGNVKMGTATIRGHEDAGGSAARFFYCAKASKADRDHGLELAALRTAGECTDRVDGSAGINSPRAGAGRTSGARNFHPTVKPTDLMRYLCRLITPPNGLILDPYLGSGSTGKGAILEGFNVIGIEREQQYFDIAVSRISRALEDSRTLWDDVEQPEQLTLGGTA